MSMTRNLLGLALIAVAGTAVSANPVPNAQLNHERMEAQVDGLRTAQAIGAQSSGVRQDAVYAYNTLDCHPDFQCRWDLNLGWSQPNCFFGGDDCGVWILPMGYHLPPGDNTPLDPWDVLPYHALHFDLDGYVWALDIYWDDYEADASVWGDINELQPMVAFTGICWTFGNWDGMQYRIHGFIYGWMDGMGEEWFGGWRWEPDVDAGESWLYTLTAGEVDNPLDPADAFDIPYAGLMVMDYDNITVNGLEDLGAWSTFLGGDLADPAFPYPTELYLVGYNDEGYWFSTGIDDPQWDGEEGYLGLTQQGYLIAIQWGDLAQGSPSKIAIPGDNGNGCPGDVTGDGKTGHPDLAALLAAYGTCQGDPGYNPNADFTGNNCVGHGDLAFLLADYGCGY